MIKTVIFDFDGTIADTFSTVSTILRDLSEIYGYEKLSEGEIEKMRDYTIYEILKKTRVPFYKLPLLVRDVQKELHKRISDLKAIRGMEKVLHALKENGYQLAIVTSNNRENVKTFLKKNNLDFFDFIYTGTTLFGKALVISGLLKKYNLKKDSVIYIGDEIRDVEATKKVGIPIIAGSWGFNSQKGLESFSPEFMIDSPNKIISILENFNNFFPPKNPKQKPRGFLFQIKN